MQELCDGLSNLVQQEKINNEETILLCLFWLVTNRLGRRCDRIVEGIRGITEQSIFRTRPKIIFDEGEALGRMKDL